MWASVLRLLFSVKVFETLLCSTWHPVELTNLPFTLPCRTTDAPLQYMPVSLLQQMFIYTEISIEEKILK